MNKSYIARTIGLLILLCWSSSLAAQDGKVSLAEKVAVYQDDLGAKLQINGEDYQIKGVVWDYTPIGENYNYSLWSQSPNFIRRILERDGQKMAEMGVNTIRTFSTIPPKWVTYLYTHYGIRTIINPLFGRYGVVARGKWNYPTDYSDKYQRQAILKDALDTVERYKDTLGVLFFLFGNENNYGLEWSSAEIEDLPTGEQNLQKAAYLYTLFEEAIQEAKAIDTQHPIGFINGDLQYANLFKDIVKSADLIGLNSYRGVSFGDLFTAMKDVGKPFVFTEIGADAYNAALDTEDQVNQQIYIIKQQQEIYDNAYGKNDGLVMGSFVFSWLDGWWKHNQADYDLSLIHDTVGTWANGAYAFDYEVGENNMNEEWFGIAGLAPKLFQNDQLELRSVYYGLQKLWELDLFGASPTEVAATVNGVLPRDSEFAIAQGNLAKQARSERNKRYLSIDGMALRGIASLEMHQWDTDVPGQSGRGIDTTLKHAENVEVTLATRPFDNLYARATLRLVGNYYDPYFLSANATQYGSQIAQLYSAEAHYDNKFFDLNFYYRNGHSDWAAEGDFFFLLPETFDRHKMDTEGSQAPFGLEFIGNKFLTGLTVYTGPEIFKGALPQVAAKYNRDFHWGDFSFGFGLLFTQEFNFADGAVVYDGEQASRNASIYAHFGLDPYFNIDAGMLWAGSEQIGKASRYYTPDGPLTFNQGTIGLLDTFAAKVKISTSALRYTKFYAQGILAGAVAEGNGGAVSRDGFIGADSGLGNRMEAELGAMFSYSFLNAGVKARIRRNIYQALPTSNNFNLPKRSTLTSPFAVELGNREVIEGELMLALDPTGATYFFNYDMADNENAFLAGSLSFLFTAYAGPTDTLAYTPAGSTTKLDWPEGIGSQVNLWAGVLKVASNPGWGLHLVGSIIAGNEGSTGKNDNTLKFYQGVSLDGWWGPVIWKTYLRHNYWGPESFHREFLITYPWQWGIDIGFALGDKPSLLKEISKVGIKIDARHFEDTNTDANKYDFQIEYQLYLTISIRRNQAKLRSK